MSSAGNMQHRALWHDYRDKGFYMLTLVTDERRPLLGELVGESASDARVVPTAIGSVLLQEIAALPTRYPELIIRATAMMPDHCHLLVQVTRPMATHLGKVVWSLKYGTTSFYLNQLNARYGGIHRVASSQSSQSSAQRGDGNTVSNMGLSSSSPALVQGGVSALNLTSLSPILVPPLWSKGYHDRIVKRKGQIDTLIRYIHSNPSRSWLQRHALHHLSQPHFLTIPISLSLAQSLKDFALYWDSRRSVAQSSYTHRSPYANTYTDLLAKFLFRRRTDDAPYLRFKAVGNDALLTAGRPLIPIRFSRSIPRDLLQKQQADIFLRCEKEGAILISPFSSPAEKETKILAKQLGYPIIELRDKAMSDLWHPSTGTPSPVQGGFSAPNPPSDMDCTLSASMLTLSPWHDRPESSKPLKPDMELLNEICRVLSLFDES